MLAYNEGFVSLWVGSHLYGGRALTLAAGGVAFGSGVLQLWRNVLVGTGEVRQMVVIEAAHATVNLAGSLAFTWWLGLPGAVLGTLLAMGLTQAWYYPTLLQRNYGIRTYELISAVLAPLGAGIAYSAAAAWLALQFPITTWVDLLGRLALSVLLFLAAAFFVLLSHAEREELARHVRVTLGSGGGA